MFAIYLWDHSSTLPNEVKMDHRKSDWNVSLQRKVDSKLILNICILYLIEKTTEPVTVI